MNQGLATATILEQPLPLPHIGMCQDGTSTARAVGLCCQMAVLQWNKRAALTC